MSLIRHMSPHLECLTWGLTEEMNNWMIQEICIVFPNITMIWHFPFKIATMQSTLFFQWFTTFVLQHCCVRLRFCNQSHYFDCRKNISLHHFDKFNSLLQWFQYLFLFQLRNTRSHWMAMDTRWNTESKQNTIVGLFCMFHLKCEWNILHFTKQQWHLFWGNIQLLKPANLWWSEWTVGKPSSPQVSQCGYIKAETRLRDSSTSDIHISNVRI